MSVFFKQGKGYRFDFIVKKQRYSSKWYPTKKEAIRAEAERREELRNQAPVSQTDLETPIDITFYELVNRRLDHVKAYNSEEHYDKYLYMGRRWIKHWKGIKCSEISTESIRQFLIDRLKATSAFTANKDLRYLRATFNFGMHPTREWFERDPTRGIEFFPVEKRIKYVPPKEDVLKVIEAADTETQDYLWAIVCTMGRMSEINRLTWNDVDFKNRTVTLYTRKKKGGHLTPRRLPMSEMLHDVLLRRHENRSNDTDVVFWHRYWSRKAQAFIIGSYLDRKKLMKTLCAKAGVRYFRYHALRHFGASSMDQSGVPIGSIQRLLGHQNRTTTEIYLHSMGDSEKQAMDVLGSVFQKNHTQSPT